MNTHFNSGGQGLKMLLWAAVIGVLVLIGITTGFWLLILPLGLFAFGAGRGGRVHRG